MRVNLSSAKLKSLSQKHGLNYLSYLNSEEALTQLKDSRKDLSNWQKSGFNAEMDFMSKSPEFYTKLEHILPETKSIMLFACSYHNTFEHNPKPGFGRVAKYAWGKDYHKVLKKRLQKFMKELEELIYEEVSDDKLNYRIFSDAVPVLERALFEKTNKGFIGKNSLMIIPGLGSWTFIAEVFSNIEFTQPLNILKDIKENQSCGTCTSCKDNCPTDAIVKDFVVDARKCISYLTIEKKTEFNSWESKAIEDWIFGCDICQEVCPFNHEDIPKSSEEKFEAKNGAGPYVSLTKILSMNSREEFLESFAGTPLMRAGLESLQRNAIAICKNQGGEEGRKGLEVYLERNGGSERADEVRKLLSG